jgi:creatinine amidohydrolase/Fe(II)-dependent formamide hydrolase-like protein
MVFCGGVGAKAQGGAMRWNKLLSCLALAAGAGLAATAPAAASTSTLSSAAAVTAAAVATDPRTSVMLEDLTSTELRARIGHGATTVLVPIGGVEQSGPYIALGKHNVRAGILARMIAQKLGNTIVAPVVAYVPEGSINPPVGHMRFAGTISIPAAAFDALLEGTAASLRQHGFRDIVFIGDHGGYQKDEVKVADKLNKAWRGDGAAGDARVHALLAYYDITQTAFVADLKKRGYSDAEIGLHAGLADASLMLATDPALVRSDAMARGPKPGPQDGVRGDATRASAELGQLGVQHVVDTSVAAIAALLRDHHH